MTPVTIEEVQEVRSRLHCSIRRATAMVKKERLLDILEIAIAGGKAQDFREFMIEVINEIYKD